MSPSVLTEGRRASSSQAHPFTKELFMSIRQTALLAALVFAAAGCGGTSPFAIRSVQSA